MTSIVLASSSPRRVELLKQAGIQLIVQPADIDEVIQPGETPEKSVTRLAEEKALAVAQFYPDQIVLGADTIVFYNNRIIGKPADLKEARNVLQQLSGNTHWVYTGTCIVRLNVTKTVKWISKTEVTFNQLSEECIDNLISNTNPLDKAGGYAIQNHEELLIARFDGLRSNVMGLPIEEVLKKLNLFT